MLNQKEQFEENVVLIDAAFLNFVIKDMRKYFERVLGRTLQNIDVSLLSLYLALDAGIKEGDNKVQFLFIYDNDCDKLLFCEPNDLRTELNGVAFKSSFGEFSFAGVPCEGMTSRAELFRDLVDIIAATQSVKRLIVISHNEEYGKEIGEQLQEIRSKTIIQFRMDDLKYKVDYQWEMLVYPLMEALGIKGEELQ